MRRIVIRDATPGDFESICALNLADVQHTSPMDSARLGFLDGLAGYHKVGCVDGHVASFLLAIRSGAPYANDNFEWFADRYASFVYVDRIVVGAGYRDLRLGTLLYEDLFRFSRSNGIPWITCEYNIVPPNEPSRRFHDKFGFKEQGTQWLANGTKQVSLQAAQT
jgi:uncharacterized protein